MNGTTPRGAANEREASAWVRSMFSRIAPRYDLANHLLSFNLDRGWRAETVRRARPVLERPSARSLDLCCGTGDLMLALAQHSQGQVFGSDFCHPMLLAAGEKMTKIRMPPKLFEADALQLPLADEALDLITVAFGFRNLTNYERGLAEMRRVLKPQGMAAILEFSQPPNGLFAALYSFYSRCVLPAVGGMVSGSRDAYEYLPESIQKFPGAEQLADGMRAAGFRSVDFLRMTGGSVALHIGIK